MNFNELISNAQNTADRRKKAFTELKKAAPEIFRQYAEAMKGLGYSSSYFYGKLFLDQAEFSADNPKGSESSLSFNFETLKMIEGTREKWECDGMKTVYDGTEYDLEFMENTNGLILLDFLACLPNRIKTCIEAQEKTIQRIEEVIS